MRVTLSVDASQLLAAIGRLKALASAPTSNADLRDGLVDAGRAYMGDMRDRFKSASGGDGTWAPLSPVTIYKRLVNAGNNAGAVRAAMRDSKMEAAIRAALPILYVTGGLYSSMFPGASGYVEEITDTALLTGTSHHLARFHQSGTPRMPARPLLVKPTDDGKKRMRDLIAAGLRSATSGAAAQ